MDLVDVDLMVIMTCHTCLTPIILDRHLVHITNTTITMIANMDAVMSTITTNNVTDIKEAIGGTVKKSTKNVHTKIKIYYFLLCVLVQL
jgi:hypothetical protein